MVQKIRVKNMLQCWKLEKKVDDRNPNRKVNKKALLTVTMQV